MLYKPYRCTIWYQIKTLCKSRSHTSHCSKKKPVLIPGLCKALEQASVKHLICWEHFTNGGHFQWVMLIPQRLLPHHQFGLPFLHWVVPCTLELVLPLVTAKKWNRSLRKWVSTEARSDSLLEIAEILPILRHVWPKGRHCYPTPVVQHGFTSFPPLKMAINLAVNSHLQTPAAWPGTTWRMCWARDPLQPSRAAVARSWVLCKWDCTSAPSLMESKSPIFLGMGMFDGEYDVQAF